MSFVCNIKKWTIAGGHFFGSRTSFVMSRESCDNGGWGSLGDSLSTVNDPLKICYSESQSSILLRPCDQEQYFIPLLASCETMICTWPGRTYYTHGNKLVQRFSFSLSHFEVNQCISCYGVIDDSCGFGFLSEVVLVF